MDGADESSDEVEEVEADNVTPSVGSHHQIQAQIPNPPRRYPLRNRKLMRRFGNNVYEQ